MNGYTIRRHSSAAGDSTTLLFMLILFVICPFAAFLLALAHAASKPSYVIYALFGMIFAWHMDSTGSDRFDDLMGIMARFRDTNVSFQEVSTQFWDLITFSKDAPKEWYETFMLWLSKNISDNPHFYFFLCSLPWLFFELSSLNEITSDKKFRQSWICLAIMLLFVFPRDIISVQNPRFTTATWVAIYATIKYYKSIGINLTYAALIFITPIIHSAFWFYVLAFMAGNLLHRYPRISIVMLYVSIPFAYLSYDLLATVNFSSLPLPSSLSRWIERYMSEEFYKFFIRHDGASGYYWVGNMFGFFMKTAYLLIPFYLIRYRTELQRNKNLWNMCGYFIFFYALVSFIQFIPVLGERFYWLVRIFGIYVWFKAIYPRHNWVVWFILFGCSWGIFRRYFYHGAVESSVPLGILYEPLPMLIDDML